jgi:hypothetical protein
MAPRRKPPVQVQDLHGFRYLRRFADLWQPLRDCVIDPAGNRSFFYDPSLALLLLSCFTPALTSLRGLRQATTLAKVQNDLGLPKAPGRGTLSAAARDFDAALLQPIRAPRADRAVAVSDGKQAEALAGRTAVAGSVVTALPRRVWALWMDEGPGGVQRHLPFESSRRRRLRRR